MLPGLANPWQQCSPIFADSWGSQIEPQRHCQPKAKIQTTENAVWWSENRSLDEAIRWLIVIESAINGLAENAERHTLARESESFDIQVRQLNVGISGKRTHRILFSIHDDRVVVYAVRNLAQRDITPDDLK